MTIAEGDLFHESRKAPATEVSVATPVPPPNVELIGVMFVGPEPEALIKDSSQGNAVRHVFKGDDVGGYTVSAISPTEVILTSPGGGEVPLPLALNRTTSPPGKDRKRGKAARADKKRKDADERPTAAGVGKRGRGKDPSEVRERLRELRRKRREASKARR
jgi:hypothetical protein